MAKKGIKDVPLKGRRVLVRADFNVPLTASGEVANDRRIRATVPTIRALLEAGAAVILMSHVGRPSGDPDKDRKLRTDRIAARLSDLLGIPVQKADEVVGDQVRRLANNLGGGEVLLLENLRFHPGEKKNDAGLAAELARLADLYVNDAFGTCHRSDASTVAVPRQFPPGCRLAGLLLQRELEVLDRLLSAPAQPLVAVLGGAKVSDKIKLIENLLVRAWRLLIGGAMSYTFLRAQGRQVGRSLIEQDHLETARRLADLAGEKLRLPPDHVVAAEITDQAQAQTVAGAIPEQLAGGDIGPQTIDEYGRLIAEAGTVVWNGPMGVFELPGFRRGTQAVAQAMADSAATTVVGGGETAEAVEQFGLAERMTHVSTGGGAFLAYLAGEQFESLAALDDA